MTPANDTASLRVGVPVSLTRFPPHTSVQRIWTYGLEALRERVDLRVRPLGSRRGRWSRVDVWLSDGHKGPIPVRRPVVAHLHEAPWDDPDGMSTMDPSFVQRYRKPSEDAARQAVQIITGSAHSRRQIVDAYGVHPDRVHVVFDGVDLEVHRPGLSGGSDLVAAAGGDGDAPYILFVGTVHPRKNLPLLRAAVERLAGEGFPHRLVLVSGPAPDRSNSEDLLAAATGPIAGRCVVNLAGIADEDLARVMAGADVLCLPSMLEGFGMPVVEAMACGTPVVVSDRGSLPEVVDGAGVVVDPTVDGVTEGLRQVLADPRRAEDLRHRGLDRATVFDWAHMADGWTRVLALAAGHGDRKKRRDGDG